MNELTKRDEVENIIAERDRRKLEGDLLDDVIAINKADYAALQVQADKMAEALTVAAMVINQKAYPVALKQMQRALTDYENFKK